MPTSTLSALTQEPDLTVVVASVNGLDVLRPTLDALDALPERDRIEVIVVETVGSAVRATCASGNAPSSSSPPRAFPFRASVIKA